MPSQPHVLFFEEAQLAVSKTVAAKNSSNVNLLSCFIISGYQIKLFSQTIIALF
jgi:hypothetical protein